MKNFIKNGGLVLAGSVAGISSAFAAVPASVTTALTDAGTDTVYIASAVLVIVFGIWAFKKMQTAK